MDKITVLNELRATRQIHNPGETRLWKEAFRLYKESQGVNLSMKCNKCFAKVKEWLEQ